MAENNFFSKNDFIRVMLLASSLFFFVGTIQSVFLHSQYSGQVNNVKDELSSISGLMDTKAEQSYSAGEEGSLDYKKVSEKAKSYSKEIEGPEVTPFAYVFFNHWVSSAAFTRMSLSPSDLGVPNATRAVFEKLKNEEVLGGEGWTNRQEFRGFSKKEGEYVVFLKKLPEAQTYFWTFYIFCFLIAIVSIYVGTKEKYSFSVVPELIYGALCFLPFWVIFSFAGAIAETGLLGFLDPTNVDLFIYIVAMNIMGGIGVFSGLIAGLLRMKFKEKE